MKKLISILLALSLILSFIPAFAADGDTVTIEAEDLYTNGKTTVFNRTVSDSSASGSKWLCADSSYCSVGTNLTMTFTVPDDMTAAKISLRYKGKSSGRAKGTLSIYGKDYMSVSMIQSKETYYTTDLGPIVKLTPGEEVTLTYTITSQGVVAIDCIYLTYASTIPESDDEIILNEDFTDCADNFGFASNASVTDGVLKLFEETAANYTLTTKTFDSSVSSLSKVDVTFDWTSHLYKKSGSKIGLEFRDSEGYIIFAIMNGSGGSQLRYSTTSAVLASDTTTAEGTIPTPTTITYNTTDTPFNVHFVADFAESTISYEITDKNTGFIVAQGINQSTSAKNLSKMIGGNYYLGYSSSNLDNGQQDIDNLVIKGMSAQSYNLIVNYTLDGETIETYDFGTVYPDSTVTIGSTDAFYAGGYLVNTNEENTSYTVNSSDASDGVITKTVPVEIVQKHVILADNFANNNSVNDSGDKNNHILVAAGGTLIDGTSRAPLTDADENVTQTGCSYYGSARVGIMSFPIDSSMAGKAVILNAYVAHFKANGGSTGGNVRLAAYPITNRTDIEEIALAYDDASLTSSENPIFSMDLVSSNQYDIKDINSYVRFDVSEAVQKALSENLNEITFKILTPSGGVYLADKEQAHLTGNYPGKAAYLEIADAYSLSVSGSEKITKNGSLVSSPVLVPNVSDVNIYAGDCAVFTDNEGKLYAAENGILSPALTENFSLTGKKLGVSMVNGAQVRFGAGVDELGKVMAENGLRFIATVDRSDTLASMSNVEFGIAISAENSTETIYIPATKFQDESQTVFTAALTNLAETNYNRIFSAKAYVKFTDAFGVDKIVTTTGVDRSIYQVSCGLLKNGVTKDANGEIENNDYTTANSTLKNVLMAYVNQVGVRLNLSSSNGASARTEGTGAYSSDAFFTATSIENGDGSYTITVTPDASFKTKVEINENWWLDYVRINNNNSIVRECITDVSIDENGALTFTFTLPAE